MEKLKLLNEVDYEYYETSMIRQFSKPKEVKYEGKVSDPRRVDEVKFIKYISKDLIDLLVYLTITPFITENQILSIVRDRNGRISSQKHVKLNNALRSLRCLGILKKYEYSFSTQPEKEIAYVLVNSWVLSQAFSEDRELAEEKQFKAIPEFNRKMLLQWENASRLLWNLGAVEDRLYNIKGTPVIFFEYQKNVYGIAFGYESRITEISMKDNIPIFMAYFEDYSENHDPQSEILYSTLEKPVSEWFKEFDVQKWKQSRHEYIKQKRAEEEYRRKHPILSKFL